MSTRLQSRQQCPRSLSYSQLPSRMSASGTMASANSDHRRRSSSSHIREKFPDLDRAQFGDYLPTYDERDESATLSRTPSPTKASSSRNERLLARKDNHLSWGNGHLNVSGAREHGHSRQKSLSDAFRTIRNRKASVSENAHEIADALKAPISVRTIVCVSSSVSVSPN